MEYESLFIREAIVRTASISDSITKPTRRGVKKEI